jgi:transcriptional regulator with XRE-family HTH domain
MYKELAEYLNKELIKQSVKRNRTMSQNEFAMLINVSPTSLSSWMRGIRLPQGENVHKIAETLGPKIYDICGEPRRMPKDERLVFIAENWVKLNQEQQKEIETQTAKFIKDNEVAYPKQIRIKSNSQTS